MDVVERPMQGLALPGSSGVTHAGSLARGPVHECADTSVSHEPYDSEATDEEDKEAMKLLNSNRLLPTGCFCDDRMKLHCNADFTSPSAHPEDPRRTEGILKAFKKARLVCGGPQSNVPRIVRDTLTKYM